MHVQLSNLSKIHITAFSLCTRYDRSLFCSGIFHVWSYSYDVMLNRRGYGRVFSRELVLEPIPALQQTASIFIGFNTPNRANAHSTQALERKGDDRATSLV